MYTSKPSGKYLQSFQKKYISMRAFKTYQFTDDSNNLTFWNYKAN